MSGFLINPYIYGGAAPAELVSIDFSGTVVQDDLDIDMTGYDELEVYFHNPARNGTNQSHLLASTDGGSTIRTTAGDYWWTSRRFGDTAVGTFIPFAGAVSASGSGVWGYGRIMGFNRANHGIGYVQNIAYGVDGASDRVGQVMGVTSFNNVNWVRLGVRSQWANSGILLYRKIVWADSQDITAVDYSVTNSTTTFYDVLGFDEAIIRAYNPDPGNIMLRASLDGSSFLSSSIYGRRTEGSSGGAYAAQMAFDSDRSTVRTLSPLHAVGFNDGGWTGIRTQGENLGDFGQPKYGHIAQTSQINSLGIAEFDDATDYTAGVIDGYAIEWNNKDAGVTAVSASSTEFIVDVSGDWKFGQLICQPGVTQSASEGLLITYSIDNGATYESSNYIVGRNDLDVVGSQSSINLSALGTTDFSFFLDIAGLENGLYTTIGGCVGGSTPRVFGTWTGGTDKVTHIKFALPTANWDGGFSYSWRLWN